jgi:cellulose synthase/poly-beta-1,6-N-acetylglucosamine synthase-like glycosyltransferase
MTELLTLAMIVLSLLLFGVATVTVWWMLHAWRDPVTYDATGFAGESGPPERSFSLLIPARHEEAVLEQTLERVLRLDYPHFEVIVIVGHDDPSTAAVAEAVADRNTERVRVVVDRGTPKNKPRALNAALEFCSGEVVGVFDAEDEVHQRLLRAVDRAFGATNAEVVQGGVQLINFRSSWFALRNCVEYFFWFRSRLHLHEQHRFIPLGGNTVFVRTDVLRFVGGWDEDCLAEDCELGVRLSALGARISVCYDPHLVTREETPETLWALLKQRTRWNQGFLQVLRKGEWRRLPTRSERLLARYTLAQPFLQALSGVAIPIAFITALLAKVPVGVALITFLPALPMTAMVVFEAVGLREFCRVYYFRPRALDYVRLVVGTPFYQVVLAVAACRAVARELRGQRGWEKTEHTGAHRDPATAPLVEAASPQRRAA